jgi:hypothetical protein
MKFSINLNGVNVVALNESGDFRGFIQESVGSNVIKPGATNTLDCRIEEGTGTIAFSDVVIWYQRNI